jgi:signal transduction histidine kinase
MMRKQIRQLSDVVDHVLRFAANSEATPTYTPRPVSVSAAVQSVIEDLFAFIEQNGITLDCSIPDDLPEVLADASVLSQCLQTLIVNAIKYSGQSRWVGISAKRVLNESGRDEVQITVRDRGLGIKASELAHIFEPFYRSPAVTAANIHGSGLGLSLARSLVEAVGGRITVISELGKGSAFTLHLEPSTSPKLEAVEPTPAASS